MGYFSALQRKFYKNVFPFFSREHVDRSRYTRKYKDRRGDP